ncbi:MAG: hypothetical protein AAF337_13610 [Pseudomonadota bacterium]
MMSIKSLLPETLTTGCTVEIENTFDSLHAHVRLDGGLAVYPGDEVTVHGKPIEVPYGHHETFRRTATVKRAGLFERLWTKATGEFEVLELCEFSFSEKRL